MRPWLLILLCVTTLACSAPGPTPMAAPSPRPSPSPRPLPKDVPQEALDLDLMVTHHQHAVFLAQEVIRRGERPATRQLAREIVLWHRTELSRLNTWRAEWFPRVGRPSKGDLEGLLGGIMPRPPMEPLQDRDERFVTELAMLHEEGLRLAREIAARAEHPELRTWAAGEARRLEGALADLRSPAGPAASASPPPSGAAPTGTPRAPAP